MSNAPRFAILRTQKLKHLASVRRSLKHSFREQDTPNADQSRTPENSHYGAGSTAEAMAAVEARLPEKRRKDAVLVIEYLVTASPEAMQGKSREQQDAYFADSLEWLKERHGAENVVYAGIHRDETTPHMYAYVVPLDRDTGRLNAKKWLGGSKALNQMQTEFADRIGQRHGLERGIEGSKASHQTLKGFYAEIGRTGQHLTITPDEVAPKVVKKGIFKDEHEAPEVVAARLTKAARQAYAPAVEGAKLAASERRRADEMTQTAQTLSREKKEAQEGLQALQKHLAPVLELATLAKQEFVQLVSHAQERVKAIKAEREKAAEREKLDQERQRRVDDLARVERKTAGAACTFAQRALAAIEQAGGQIGRVDWQKVENAAILESIREHQQPPRDVLAAVVRYSPGMVEPARQEQARAFISTLVGKEIAAPKVGKQHDLPSLG